MSVPFPPALDQLGSRPFSFYPPILNVENNEWTFRRATWSEILVANTRGNVDLWVPRRYLGEISAIDQPVVIVGLSKELEYKAGGVWPHERRVLPMPATPSDLPRSEASEPAPVRHHVHRPAPPSTESRIGKLIGTALTAGILICFLVVFFFRAAPLRSKVKFTSKDEAFLELTRLDDYYAVVRKLGEPSDDKWKSETGELQYRRLWYPQRSYYVVLMGPDRKDTHYIGSLDTNWHVVHYVELSGGGNTASMLRTLPRF